MLKKEVEHLIVGKSYLAILLGLELQDQGRKVYLIDDQRVGPGIDYSSNLTDLEVHFLKSWGKERGIGPFLDIDKYLKKGPISFSFDDVTLKLGRGPLKNFLELYRKMPFLIDENIQNILKKQKLEEVFQLGEIFNSYCKLVAENIYCYRSIQNIKFRELLSLFSKDLGALFVHFSDVITNSQNITSSERHALMGLLYNTNATYHHQLGISGGQFELLHLMISILSHRYILDEARLEKDLIDLFIKRGGAFESAQIINWNFSNNRPWCVELDNYEGILRPQNIFVVGGTLRELPFGPKGGLDIFSSLHIVKKFNDQKNSLPKQKVVKSKYSRVGMNTPMWEAEIKDDEVLFRVWHERMPGEKKEFILDQINKELEHDWFDLWGISFEECFDNLRDHCFWGHDIRYKCEWGKFGKSTSLPIIDKVKLYDYSTPKRGRPLNHVHYLGPYIKGGIGPLGPLMEIKAVSEYI
jgi:hypothetical protein